MKNLLSKTIIVTGASRGIGWATALELARRGANVVALARDLEKLRLLAGEIELLGARALALECDVSSYGDALNAVTQTLERFGALHGVVNNAGMIEPIARLEAADPTIWKQALEVNLLGAFHLCRAALPHLLERGEGVIVNVSSGAAHRPLEGWSAYCAAKAGLAMLTRSLALEAGPRGVRAYGFQPGVVDTEMQSAIRASGLNEVSRLPRESLARPDDPARAIAWLCSSEAADLAGQELSVGDESLRRRAGLEVGV